VIGVVAGVVVSIGGLVAGILYDRYRNKVNRQECQHAIDMMDREDIKNDIDLITENLIFQHQAYLLAVKPVEAIQFAKQLCKTLSHNIMEGKLVDKVGVVRWSNTNVITPSSSNTLSIFKKLSVSSPATRPASELFIAPEKSITPVNNFRNFFMTLFSCFKRDKKLVVDQAEKKAELEALLVNDVPTLGVSRSIVADGQK
jgi:hypothetical protein